LKAWQIALLGVAVAIDMKAIVEGRAGAPAADAVAESATA
jgi:hypothetical protein